MSSSVITCVAEAAGAALAEPELLLEDEGRVGVEEELLPAPELEGFGAGFEEDEDDDDDDEEGLDEEGLLALPGAADELEAFCLSCCFTKWEIGRSSSSSSIACLFGAAFSGLIA